jgi:hypothetical protein
MNKNKIRIQAAVEAAGFVRDPLAVRTWYHPQYLLCLTVQHQGNTWTMRTGRSSIDLLTAEDVSVALQLLLHP